MLRILFAVLLCTLPALAQSELEQTQALANEAAGHFRARDYGEALRALQKAEPIAREANDPTLASIRFNIARCYEELGQWREATSAYEAYLKLPDDAHRKARAWKALEAAERKLYGTLEITCNPGTARIEVRELPDASKVCPVRLKRVEPGTYQVAAALEGYVTLKRTVQVEAGHRATVALTLERDPASLPPPAAPVDRGAPPPEPAPASVWPWATAGAGALLIAAGGVLTATALDARDEAEALPPGEERDDQVERFELERGLSYGAYAVGATALVWGVAWIIFDAPEPKAAVGRTPLVVRW